MHREKVMNSLEKLLTLITLESIGIAGVYFHLMLFWVGKLVFISGSIELVAAQIRYCAKGLGVTYLISFVGSTKQTLFSKFSNLRRLVRVVFFLCNNTCLKVRKTPVAGAFLDTKYTCQKF